MATKDLKHGEFSHASHAQINLIQQSIDYKVFNLVAEDRIELSTYGL